MKYANPVKKWIREYRKKNGLTRHQLAEKFKCSPVFLERVVDHVDPCPFPFLKRMAKILKIDEEILGISFGYYPADWIWFARSYPEQAIKALIDTLDKEDVFWSGPPTLKKTPACLQVRIRAKDLRLDAESLEDADPCEKTPPESA